MKTVDETRRGAWIVQEHSLKVLERVVRACAADGVDALPVKGILSARTLYDDVADRVISDIDVRVRPRDLERVARIARREGWTVVHRMRAYDNLVLRVDGREVDVEAHIGPPGLCSLEIDTMISRATRESRTFGFPALVADPHDHAVVLIVNAFKDHMVHALRWAIVDLERLVRAPWFDASTLLRRASESGVDTIVWIVADWMSRFMNDVEWRALRERMGAPLRAGFASGHLWLEGLGPRGELPLRLLSRFGNDTPKRWPTAIVRMLAWQAEVWASQLDANPWRRQSKPRGRERPRPSPRPGRHE